MVRKTLTVLFITLVFNLGGFLLLTPAQSSHFNFDMSEVDWKSLSFKSDNFIGTVTTKAVLEEVPVDEIESLLIASPQGVVLKPSGAKVLIATINSTIDPLIGSDEKLVTRVWFTPQEASALQRIRLRKGKEKWEKTYRWTGNGVYRLRIKPKGAEEEEFPKERWTDIENSFYPYDLAQSKCGSVFDPSALLYVVSAAGLVVGDPPLHLCVFNKKQLHRVRIRAEKHQLLKINYLEKSQHMETRRNGTAEVLKISFTSHSLFADEAKAEPFTFLGLKGDFDIFIDKVSKIPVQVSGKLPGIGRVDIKLREISLWQGSR
jgi:hypothetical protein